MTPEQLWDYYCTKNPAFLADGAVTLTTRGLKKLFDQTYDVAHTKGVANGRALEQMEQKKKATNPLNKLFEF